MYSRIFPYADKSSVGFGIKSIFFLFFVFQLDFVKKSSQFKGSWKIMRISINKNYLFHLTGCAIFLLVGARMQDAKAVYPSLKELETYWTTDAKMFCKTAESCFAGTDALELFSEALPKTNLQCEIELGSDSLGFLTASDLDNLTCDGDLKKICRVIGSKRFLAVFLQDVFLKAIIDHAGNKGCKTAIRFRPWFEKGFF